MKLENRIAGIDANLDDLQSGVEASSRAADTLSVGATRFNGALDPAQRRAIAGHVKEIQACARDQRAALDELRESVARLREELKSPRNGAKRHPPVRT